MGDGGGMGDIFDMFFSGGGGRRGQREREVPQLKPTVKGLKISLEDLYHGKMEYVKVDRKVKCGTCEGKGGKNVSECGDCRGKGMVIKMV